VCPFNKPPGIVHDVVRATIRRTALLNGLFVRMDKALGYDKRLSARRFWDG
jgi:hypothetical protein